MIQIPFRVIVAGNGEVLRGNRAYPNRVKALQTVVPVDAQSYALVQEGDAASYALSISKQLGGLNFGLMVAESFKIGLPLAGVRDVTLHHRNVNLALRGEGVLYDASGNLIENERLVQCGEAVNNTLVYLNAAYENSIGSKGFLGLDVIRVTGFAEGKPVLERQPLEEYVAGCWADALGPINSQGYYTQKAPVQKSEMGKTVYVHRPVAGCVARFYASFCGADLYGGWDYRDADSGLGGFLRAEGTCKNLEGGN
jgi:hypothetical protein